MTSQPPKDFQHKMGRRSRHNDYYNRRIYHIILKKHPEAPFFGEVSGNPSFPDGHPEAPRAINNHLGTQIEKCIRNIQDINPLLKLIDIIVMPNHVHFLLFATDKLPRHIGKDIAALKVKCNKILYCLDPDAGKVKTPVFEKEYVDVIIKKQGQLETEKKYIRDNPRRLQILRRYPDFFTRDIRISIGDERYIGFGNPFLLMKGFRFQVMVRSRWSEEEFEEYRHKCLAFCKMGGIAVSPFYSPREKIIRRDIIDAGGSVIVVSMEGFSQKSKPVGHNFTLCSEGRLLYVYEENAPLYLPHLQRATAMRMNEHARRIAVQEIIRPVFSIRRGNSY